MNTKDAFNELLKKHGYTSVHDFCLKQQTDYSNMNKRVNGVRQKVEISFMFKIANMLHEPVDVIVHIFYPEEYEENQAIAKGKKKGK